MPITPQCVHLDPVGQHGICECNHPDVGGQCSESRRRLPGVTYCGTCAYQDFGTVSHTDTNPEVLERRMVNCDHAGHEIAAVPGDRLDCKCDSVRVFHCRYFDRPATTRIAREDHLAIITAHVPEYTGRTCHGCRHYRKPGPPLRFIRRADLLGDIEALAAQVPLEVSAIAGVPRSGLLVASDIAIRLSLPLLSVGETLHTLSSGHRLTELPPAKPGPLLVVEDSTNTGDSLRTAVERAALSWPGTILSAAVYANPGAGYRPNLAATWLPTPHLFEWHLFASHTATRIGWDIDGVLFRERPPHGPLYVPRWRHVPLIATGRHERHRSATDAWLAAWGITYDRLVMYDGPEGDPSQHTGRHKAEAYRADPRCKYFVESCPKQAQTIAELSGRPVICPSTGEVFQ